MNAKESLLSAFQDGTLAGKTSQEILKILQIPYREKNRLFDLLNILCDEGVIFKNEGGRYGTIEQLGLIKGTIFGNERGFAFLIPEGKEKNEDDLFIPHKSLRGALHGDTVLVERAWGRSDDEGAVVKILARGYATIVGIFRRDRRTGYLFPTKNVSQRKSISPFPLVPTSKTV